MFIEVPTLEALTVTFIVTAVRTLLESSPTLLGGVVVAAYLRTQVEPERLSAIFPHEGSQGVLRAALVGMILPVCSVGVLPVLRELRRMGLSTGKLITVGIVAPLLNPLSLIYGLSVLSASQFLLIVVATGIAAMTLADVGSRFAISQQIDTQARPAGLTGGTRLRNLLIASSRLATGQTLLDLMLVVFASALIASFLRSGAFYLVCEPSNGLGPIIALLFSVLPYVSPARGIIQFAGLGNANLSIATGLAIYLFGTGLSAASILSLSRWLGVRRLFALTLALSFAVCGFTSLLSFTLPAPLGNTAETSALDGMTRPSVPSFQRAGAVLGESLSFVDPLMILGSVAIAILLVMGLVVRLMKIVLRDDDPEVATQQNSGRLSKAIPASQLGAISMVGIGVLFTLSMYVFYPGPQEFIDEMELIQLDCEIAIRGGKVDVAIDRLTDWDSWAARVPIGAAIRGAFPTPVQRMTTRDLRKELRRTREFLVEGDLRSARDQIESLESLLSQTTDAFNGSSS